MKGIFRTIHGVHTWIQWKRNNHLFYYRYRIIPSSSLLTIHYITIIITHYKINHIYNI